MPHVLQVHLRVKHSLHSGPDSVSVPRAPSFFHSMTAAMAMVETLLALLVARGGRAAVKAIARSRAQLLAFAAYWRERETIGGRR